MEYIDGEDLSSLLRRIGRLPADKAVQSARQLCAGLAAAHDLGVLHRDLKPANVMLDGRGTVKITDFGLADFAGQITPRSFAGTPAYMAPEQLAGRAGDDQQRPLRAGPGALRDVHRRTGVRGWQRGRSRARLAGFSAADTLAGAAGYRPGRGRVIVRCLDPEARNRGAVSGYAIRLVRALRGRRPQPFRLRPRRPVASRTCQLRPALCVD